MAKIVKFAAILGIFCVISAGALAFVYLFTKPRIELYAKLAFEKSLREVLPPSGSFTRIVSGTIEAQQGAFNNKIIGRAFSVSPQGYSGKILLLVGIDNQGRVLGVKILSHRETPGLGSKIVKPEFLRQFTGKNSKDRIEPKKDIDAITGATISSRAVAKGVREALGLYELLERF